MSKNPKVSFIIPVYNAEKYLGECLDSVINQTLKDIEIICIDDQSTDASLALLEQYGAKDKRVKIIKKEKSSGAGDSRNQGIKTARGEYILFVDADDKIKPSTGEEVYAEAKKYDADICIFKAEVYDEQTQDFVNTFETTAPLIKPFNTSDFPNKIFSFCRTAVWDKMFKRQFILKHQLKFQNLYSCNDVAFTYLGMAYASKITCLEKTFYTYRMNAADSISKKRGFFCFNILLSLNFVRENLREKKLFQQVSRSFYRECVKNLKYEYQVAPVEYKPCFMAEIENFLPPQIFLQYFIPELSGRKIVLTRNHIMMSLGKLKIKIRKSRFLLFLFYKFYLRGKRNYSETTYWPKDYEQYIVRKYKKLAGENLANWIAGRDSMSNRSKSKIKQQRIVNWKEI